MTEFEKMQDVAQRATPEEQKKVIDAINVLKDAFLALVEGVGIALTANGKLQWSVSDAEIAMQTIRQIGARYDVEFPSINNTREMKLYILEWGIDVGRMSKENE